jgi:hypothetical protein
MPIWLELLVLMLIAYVVGLAIGWALWGRANEDEGQGGDG